ncbi:MULTISPECIES: peptide ABC transporter substrate-binding protein [unclassified Azospirillum]|uniref:peptide ABC transporter substrate-binding protein n=1 Tax=unclassified Azospirillum TaxID=2630922 RepID=UPI000B72BDD5|nr:MULTISPECIES: peptide ABC transporter substrate-binding protein [unclassified Azospirillum]SNR96385.1 oligopeptide transport system substrate-binding protein [Azospirillum sp. RU38E]SNS13254.1 oligopeptide transport system substrate-binding protein [Azospirillum sp. RU37A]
MTNITRRSIMGSGLSLGLALGLPGTASLAATPTILNIGLGPDIDTADPHRSTTIVAGGLFVELWEGLTSFDAAGNVVAGVATSWETSADGLRWNFTLRQDAKWSDGSPVTADDFVFAWRRAVTPATRLGLPEWIAPIRNAMPIMRGEKPPGELGVRAVGPYQLEVLLEHPKPDLTVYTAYWVLSPLHRTSVEKHGDSFPQPGKLVGNGPFILDAAIPQSHYALKRNPHYHGAASIAASAVNYHVTEDLQTEMKRFRSGELVATKEVPPTQLDWARSNLADSLRLAPRASTFFLVPNLTRAPWKGNAKLRQALAIAIDRKTIVEKIARGNEPPAYSMTPPGLVGYQPPEPDWAKLGDADRVALARRLFAEAGYGPGGQTLPPVELLYNTNELNRQVAVAVAAMWQQVLGVKTTLSNQEFKVVVSRMKEHSYPDFARISWAVGLVTEYLNLLRSRAEALGPGYRNPVFDQAMEAVDASLSLEGFRSALAAAENIAMADMPMIPIMRQSSRRLVNPALKGWVDNPLDLHPAKFLSL